MEFGLVAADKEHRKYTRWLNRRRRRFVPWRFAELAAEPMDLTLDEEGAQVAAATSFDSNFPPSNILDG